MSTKPANANGTNDLLLVPEVAKALQVAPKTAYRYVNDGTIPPEYVVRVGGAVRIKPEYLDSLRQPQKKSVPLPSVSTETLAYRVEEAADMLHVEPGNVMEAVGNGQLYAIMVGTATVIPKGELEQLVEAPAKVDQFTRQLLIQKGMVSEGFPFDNPELYKKRGGEIKAIAEYVRTRVSQLKADYSFGLRLGLDEILQHVGNEVMEGKYAQQQTNHRRGRK